LGALSLRLANSQVGRTNTGVPALEPSMKVQVGFAVSAETVQHLGPDVHWPHVRARALLNR
jgi:hypothetical protein